MFKMNPKARVPAGEKVPALPPRLTEAQAAAALRAKETELAARALEEAAAFEREQREAERAAWRAEKAKAERAAILVQARTTWSARLGQAVTFFPILVTSSMAIMGQYGWGLDHLDQIGSSREDLVRIVVTILFAAGLESLGLFQGYHADRALQRRDSAFGLYLGAFATSGIVAGINYSHYADPKETTSLLGLAEIPGANTTAVVFALFSFITPALWRIHSRAKNRDTLKAAGEIDTRAPRLAWSKKLWHPIKTVRTMYWATWEKGVETPADAIALYEAKMAAKRAEKAQRQAAKEAKRTEAAKAPEKVPAAAEAPGPENDPEPTPELEPGQAPAPIVAQRWPEAWNAYVASVQGGNKLTQRALARDYLGNNRHYAREIIAAWEEVKHVNDARTPAA
jgi:hypothetical protein